MQPTLQPLLYRAQALVARIDPPEFVLRHTPYRRIAASRDPVQEAVMVTLEAIRSGAEGHDRGWAHKALVEHAYETVRLRTNKALPSRLRSLFAFRRLEEAIQFADEQNADAVYAIQPRRSARISVHDMNLYMPPAELDVDVDSFRRRWEEACDWAHRYWASDGSAGQPEVLVDGPIHVREIVWRRDAAL